MGQFDINNVFFNMPKDNKKTQIVANDFETTVNPNEENKVYMWSTVFKDKDPINHPLFNYKWIQDNFPNVEVIKQWKEGTSKIQGLRIKDFIEIANSPKTRNSVFYFHNGAKFDGSYIFKYLIDNGYNFRQDLKLMQEFASEEEFTKLLKHIQNELLTDKQRQRSYKMELDELVEYLNYFWTNKQANFGEKDFSVLIKDNQYYQILLQNCKIWDSNKLFTMSVKQMGETLNRQFNTDIYSKDTLETNYSRLEEYKDIEEAKADSNEWPYNGQDSFVLWKFLDLMTEKIPHHLWRMTAGSTAYNLWKDVFCEARLKELQEQHLIVEKHNKYLTTYWTSSGHKIGYKRDLRNYLFQLYFPEQWIDLLTYKNLKQWYRGGITQVNPLWQGLYNWMICSIDLNSSYSAVMASLDRMLPFGTPLKGVHKLDLSKFQLMTLRINKRIINKHGMPFLTENIGYKSSEYQAELLPGQEFKICTSEYKRFIKYYSNDPSAFSIEINYTFDCVAANKIFGPFIEYFYKLKNEAKMSGDEALKTACKIFLNSPYGKFGTKRQVTKKYFDEKGNVIGELIDEMDERFFLPLGIAITAEARMTLVDGAGENYKLVVYCDTDSMYIKAPYFCTTKEATKNWIEETFKVKTDPLKIGAWDIEKYNFDGFFRRPKTYAVRSWTDNHWDFKVAGMHDLAKGKANTFKGMYGDHLGYADFIFGFKKKMLRPDKSNIAVYLASFFKELAPIWTDKPKKEQIHWVRKDKELLEEQMKQITWSNHVRQLLFNRRIEKC